VIEVMCRWTPGAGGGKANNCYTKLCEARGDLYPMLFFAVVITSESFPHPDHDMPARFWHARHRCVLFGTWDE